MNRRTFIAASCSAAPLFAARAQSPPKIARVGLLVGASLASPAVRVHFDMVRQGLADLGYIEGRNIVFEERGTDGTIDRLPALAAELAALQPDVIVAIATPAGRAAHAATATIPVVVGSMGDPVGDGLVASLSRPGGNVTGTTFIGPELVPKRLALLKQLAPAVSRIGVMWQHGAFGEQTTQDMMAAARQAADALGLHLQFVEAHGTDQFARAFADMAGAHVDGLCPLPNPTAYENRQTIVDLAARQRLPGMYTNREFADIGGLAAYGANVPATNRRTAAYVDKILRGAKPADLPVEQPTAFELVINRKTAEALGLTVPPTLLAQADEVIE